jgi:cyclophilin family peptidyl-prolyl cis-trans isomerase
MTASYRRVLLACAAVTALFGLAGCGQAAPGSPGTPAPTGGSTTTSSQAPAPPGSVRCDYTATPDQPAPAGHDVGVPAGTQSNTGTVHVVLHTSQGDVPVTMPRAAAPCTVGSFAYLAGKGFFNQSPCHRLTSAGSLKVLQCGDPTGTGTGGPGYTIPDENPTNLPSAGQASLYARGTVAMANTGQPHSGGSQFFLVYANSELPPSYAVFGQVSADGLKVLDKIAAGGVAPGGNSPQDGAPAVKVTITSTTVG